MRIWTSVSHLKLASSSPSTFTVQIEREESAAANPADSLLVLFSVSLIINLTKLLQLRGAGTVFQCC